MNYARFLRRVAAMLLDSLLVSFITYLLVRSDFNWT